MTNSISHAVGLALSIAGLSVLVTLAATRGDIWRVVSFSIYGATLVVLYLASTLYHAIWHLFVLAGSVCHSFAVLLYVLPMRAGG